MTARNRARLGQRRLPGADVLTGKDRDGEAGSHHRHEGDRVHVEGDVSRCQVFGSEMTDDENETRKARQIDEELHAAWKSETDQTLEQFEIEAPLPES